MVEQISTIASGTLIDQSVLSTIINNVNEIADSQYSSTSYFATGLSSNQVGLQNGQWIVSTVYETASVTTKQSSNSIVGPTTVNFGVSFAAKPMISATIYTSDSSLIIDNVVSSVIITDIGLDYFKYKVVFGPSGQEKNTSTSFAIMFTAIGKAKL